MIQSQFTGVTDKSDKKEKEDGEELIGTPEEDYFKNGKFWYRKCDRMWNFKKANCQ